MNLNFVSAVNNLSYGLCGLNLTLELSKLTNLSLFAIGQSSVNTSREDARVIQQCIENAKFFDRRAKSIRLFHQFSLDLFPSDYRIGFPIFELNKFNEIELHHLKSCDEILTCSSWSKKILEDNGINLPISVIPLGVNRDIFHEEDIVSSHIQPWKTSRFLMIGKREVRKGHDLMHEWFSEAFNEDDDVELWVSWHNIFDSENEQKEWMDLYQNSRLGSKIKFIPYQQSPHQLNTLYNSVDCLISLSRAEGWNLPLLEGLSCGRQIIATNYSGHTEFLNNDNSHLVQIDELETAYDGKWFLGDSGGEWAVLAEGQKEQCVEYMRLIHKNKQNGENLFNSQGVEISKAFSWEHSAKRIVEEISK